MIWASRENSPAVRGRLGVLAVLMRPPLPTLASVQEGATVCMLSTTTGHTARAKSPAKSAASPQRGLLGRGCLGAGDQALRQRRVGLQVVEQLQRPALVPLHGHTVIRGLEVQVGERHGGGLRA